MFVVSAEESGEGDKSNTFIHQLSAPHSGDPDSISIGSSSFIETPTDEKKTLQAKSVPNIFSAISHETTAVGGRSHSPSNQSRRSKAATARRFVSKKFVRVRRIVRRALTSEGSSPVDHKEIGKGGVPIRQNTAPEGCSTSPLGKSP